MKGTDHSLAASRQVLSGVRTVGRQYTVSQTLRGVDPRVVDGLSNAKQRTLGRWLARTDGEIDRGRGIATDGGQDVLEVFEYMSDVDTDTIRRLGQLEHQGVLSEADIRQLAKLKNKGKLDGDALRRISIALDTEYSNKWSPGKVGNPVKNIKKHYRDHGEDWGTDGQGNPKISMNEYIGKAKRLANKRDDVDIYYQRGQRNVVIYDDSTNELVIVNHKGEIQSFFKPDDESDYIVENIQNGNFAEVKQQ